MHERFSKQTRPNGILIISVLNMTAGIFNFLFLILFSAVIMFHIRVYRSGEFNNQLSFFMALYGAIALIIGIGLLRTKIWAYWAEIFFSIGYLIFSILQWIANPNNMSSSLVEIIYTLVILWYLCSNKNVKRFFEHKPALPKP